MQHDVQQLLDQIRRRPTQEAGTNESDESDLLDAVRLIVERRCQKIVINSVADSLHVSRRTLERRFREKLGISVRHAITLVRLEVARQLLIQTDLDITTVSMEAGFSSLSRMSNVFRRELGCSPRQIRRHSASTKSTAVLAAIIENSDPTTQQPVTRQPDVQGLSFIVECVHPATWADLDPNSGISDVPTRNVAGDEVSREIVAHDENIGVGEKELSGRPV